MPRVNTNKSSTSDADLEQISKSIKAVLQHDHSNLALSPLHACVNRLVNNSHYKNLTEILLQHVNGQFQRWGDDLNQLSSNPLITRFAHICEDFTSYCKILPKLYAQYDEYAIQQKEVDQSSSKTKKILDDRFYEIVLNDKNRMGDVVEVLLNEIKVSRTKEYDPYKIYVIIQMFYEFNHYARMFDLFREKVIEETEQFYADFFKREYECVPFPKFLTSTKLRLSGEELLLTSIFNKDDALHILEVAHKSVLFNKEEIFIKLPQDGSPPPISLALVDSDIEPLKWLVNESYQRFKKPIKDFVHTCAIYICEEILNFKHYFTDSNFKPQDSTKYIGEMMNLVLARKTPFFSAFGSDDSSKDEFTKQVSKGWNDGDFNIVTNFVNYIDYHIRSEFKNLNPEEKETFPSRCAQFFTYTTDKLPFNKTYDMSFVNRLIKMKEKLREIEYPIIEKIRSAKNADFMRNFVKLIDNVNSSNELSNEFKQKISTRTDIFPPGTKPIEFSPLVIAKNLFTPHVEEEKVVSNFLSEINSAFIQAYQAKHKQSRLTLLADVSTIESKWKVPPNEKSKTPVTYVLVADLICTKIIYAVAKNKRCSLAQINDDAQEERPLVCKYIMKLCTTNKVIRRAEFKDKKLADDDIFEMNPHFFSKVRRIIIPTQINQAKENKKKNEENIEAAKILLIRAAIVRILKQKNRVSKSDVENETIEHMRAFFTPDLSLIRKQLVMLERSETDDGYFHREGRGDMEVLVYHQ